LLPELRRTISASVYAAKKTEKCWTHLYAAMLLLVRRRRPMVAEGVDGVASLFGLTLAPRPLDDGTATEQRRRARAFILQEVVAGVFVCWAECGEQGAKAEGVGE
jgi:hypothetical protein